jgi:hypothetical protein
LVREQLVAWAGDCMVRGSVELGEGRLSDQVNELDVVTFFDVTLRALDDGHEVSVDELEVDHAELHVIEVRGRRGDPDRRLRTVEERVTVELGPFEVTGNLHRPPNTQSMAALGRWAHFVPMTDALVGLRDHDEDRAFQPVVLVNRQRIGKTRAHLVMPVLADEQPPALPA